MAIFERFAKHRSDKQTAQKIYGSIVAQARQKRFFTHYGVRDTIPGRFEMMAVHMFLFLHRLHEQGEAAHQLSQNVVDLFFADMDTVARELGIGDFGVPKRMRKLARSFYARMEGYGVAVKGGKDGALAGALQETIFEGESRQAEHAAAIARYMISNIEKLQSQPVEVFLAGEDVQFSLEQAGSHARGRP